MRASPTYALTAWGSEQSDIVAPAQKLKHRVMDCRQGKLFAHGKLLECKGSGVEHRLK